MSKQHADRQSPPPNHSQTDTRPDEQSPGGMMAAARREQAQIDDAAAAAQPAEPGASASQSDSPAAASVTISPFDRLAAVELQLVMRCCDQQTLIALARCSRFTLATASRPFAWQLLPPVALRCDWPLQLSRRLRAENSLLRHAEISVTWRLRTVEAMSAEQMAALAALPGLRGLAVKSSFDPAEGMSLYLSDEEAARLFETLGEQIDRGGALTSLSFGVCELRQAGVAALTAFIQRSRTLTALKITYVGSASAATDSLVPLATALAQCRTLNSLEMEADVSIQHAFRALVAVVQHSPSLTTFNFRGLECDAESAAALAAAVKHSRSLTDLQLNSCELQIAAMEALVAAIEQSSSGIRRLDVSGNRIHKTGATFLARLLASDRCALTALDVSGNKIGAGGVLALAEGLQTNRTLTELRLGYNNTASDGTAAVISALQHSSHIHLRVLALNGCDIDPPAAAALAETMKRIGALERLEVSGCSLRDGAMATLAAGIAHSHALQHLDVSHNMFGAAGAAALAAVIGSCPALTSLDVSNRVRGTKIGDAGMAALAPALLSVRTLKLNDCGLTLQSAAALAGLIRDSRALESLQVNMNKLGACGIAVLAAALQPSSSLRTLHVEGCDAGADGAAALADALRRGWRASDLRLDQDRSIGDSGALALAAAMTECGSRCTLATLALRNCDLTVAGAVELMRAATASPRLRSLDLGCNYSITAADLPALIAACGPQPLFELRLRHLS